MRAHSSPQAAVFEIFECTLSDGTRVQLRPDGANTPVTYANRIEYLDLCLRARLEESQQQMAAVMRGLRSLVPPVCHCLISAECGFVLLISGLISQALLRLFEWYDLSVLVCGKNELNLSLLRRHTQYRCGVSETDQHIQWFWQVMEDFSDAERRLFLRFAWGRERLPVCKASSTGFIY